MLGGIIEGCGSGPEEMKPMLVGIAELLASETVDLGPEDSYMV